MRADEAQLEGESRRRAGTGPRHAAPRKSMLTRLHMPAGKAIALAAMPTAVLMGMGLTPQLAQADPKPGPFKPGPCVSQPDESGRQAADDKGDKADGKGEESPEPSTSPEPSEKLPEPEVPELPDLPGSEADDGKAGAEREKAPAPEESSPAPEPSESQTRNPLDPLGVGDKIKDLLSGGGDDAAEEPATEPDATASGDAADRLRDGAEDAAGKATDEATDEAKSAAEKAEQEAADAKKKAELAAAEAKEKAEQAAEDAKEKAEDATESAVPAPSASEDGGPQPFPCPEYDAQALADADHEPTPALLPDEPWVLESSKLSLHGLDYKGIVKVKTWSGNVKEVLKFTASGVDIENLHQLVQGPNGTISHVKAAEGSTSTIRKGTVTMYTEELKGNLLGIIPITFSPKSPPPLNIPEVFFTSVKVTQAGQFGGELTVPGMNLYNSGG